MSHKLMYMCVWVGGGKVGVRGGGCTYAVSECYEGVKKDMTKTSSITRQKFQTLMTQHTRHLQKYINSKDNFRNLGSSFSSLNT